MIVDKPAWVSHTVDGKPTPIYAIDIHPDGRRLVTAGGDNKVRVWNMAPVRDAAAEGDAAAPKLLAALDQHAASVNTVRFSSSGRNIASGSDDTIVFVYELRPGPGRTVLGSKEENLENWQVRGTYFSSWLCKLFNSASSAHRASFPLRAARLSFLSSSSVRIGGTLRPSRTSLGRKTTQCLQVQASITS